MLAVVCHGAKDLRIEAREDAPLRRDEVRVAVSYGGICGSDLHYFHRGAVGDFTLREPMTLGHEVSGVVADVGEAVDGLEPGTPVALDPSRPCLTCAWCREGRVNLCADMKFLGSAARYPHVQGGFAQHLDLRKDQVIPVPAGTDLLKLSIAEPLSVGLHAVERAGTLMGRRVIVAGAGPIGLLTGMAARLAGASEVIWTDIQDAPLTVARERLGAAHTVNVASEPDGLSAYSGNGGYFDVAFEASGAPPALSSLFDVVRRGGRIVQVGAFPPGGSPVPVNFIQSREIDVVGAFRANGEFHHAVDLIVSGQLDVTPILSGTYPLADAVTALERAGDRSQVIKLHLAINEDFP